MHDLLVAYVGLLDDPGWRLVIVAWAMVFIVAGLALTARGFHDPRSW